MPTPPDPPSLEAQRRALLRPFTETRRFAARFVDPQLPQVRQTHVPLRRPGARDLGPQWLLSAKRNGQTRTRAIPATAVDTNRARTAECQRRRLDSGRRKNWAEEFDVAVEDEFDRFLSPVSVDRADWGAVEADVRAAALRRRTHLLSQRFEADHAPYADTAVPRNGGRAVRYPSRLLKPLTLSFGPVTIWRAISDEAA